MEEGLEKPKVSIIIPTYNSGETLNECLKSIHCQNYPFYEIIIIDNFSNDGTLKTAKEFGAKTIQEKCNPAQARNIGIANSTGKYVLFLDSDQALSPSVIEECVRKCESEKVEMVRTPEVFIGKSFWSTCSAVWKNHYEKVEQSYETDENIIHGEPRFFIKEQIGRIGMIDAILVWGENYDLYEKLRKTGVKEALCESSVYHYEPISLGKIVIKNLRYGKSMPIFVKQTKKQIIPLLPRQALLTFREVLKSSKSLMIIAGCTFLLFFKTYSMMIGLLTGLAFPTYKSNKTLKNE
jgi:glycosyltransferase involved in cell wall biosynthesis